MEDKDANTSFDLLGDNDLLSLLQYGQLDELPCFSTSEVTATQVLGLNTQDLVTAGPCDEKSDRGTSEPSAMNNADLSSEGKTVKAETERKALSTISNDINVAPENTKQSKGSTRFGDPISLQQIREKNAGAVPKKTRAVNDWSVKVWADWARNRNTQPVTVYEPGFPIPEDIGQCDSTVLNYWGQRFVNEIES